MSPIPCMRRVLVIFLVLLFPLNVFALSLSVATLPAAAVALAADAQERVHAPGAAQPDSDAGNAFGCDGGCSDPGDIDPDEPPAGADIHYIVDLAGGLQFAGLSGTSPALHDAAPRCRAVPPPVKPPRAA